jgi:hypothetical protein
MKDMITQAAIPGPMAASATTATHAWGHSFVLTWIAGAQRKYRASFFMVPQNGCVFLLMNATAYCRLTDAGCPVFVRTAAGSVAGDTLDLISNAMTVAQAETLCNKNVYPGTNANNSVEFDFIN